jgi:transcriptional regulator with XRE-family HTH domain
VAVVTGADEDVELDVPEREHQPLSAGAARRELGRQLKQVRDKAGLTLDDVRPRFQRSQATLSRLENGKATPRRPDVEALLRIYETTVSIETSRRERLLELADEGRKQEWFSPFRDVTSGRLTSNHIVRYLEFETDAEQIFSYESEFIFGLLQTEGYAHAVAELFYPDSSKRDRDRFVQFRMARRKQLGSRHLRAAVRESALRRPLGSPAARRDQLNALASELKDDVGNIEVRIVRDTLAIPQVMRGGPFTVMGFADGTGLVYLEGREGADYLEDSEIVARYRADFEAIWKESLDRDDSLALISEVIATID